MTAHAATDKEESCYVESETKTTFAGVHGGVGGTGINFVFTMRSMKTQGFGAGYSSFFEVAGPSFLQSKSTPWTLGLSRSWGGGATVNFEHGEPDSDKDSSTAIWFLVDF